MIFSAILRPAVCLIANPFSTSMTRNLELLVTWNCCLWCSIVHANSKCKRCETIDELMTFLEWSKVFYYSGINNIGRKSKIKLSNIRLVLEMKQFFSQISTVDVNVVTKGAHVKIQKMGEGMSSASNLWDVTDIFKNDIWFLRRCNSFWLLPYLTK